VVHDTVDLSQFDNQPVQLRFYFSTGDNLYNDFQGWSLKNIQVTGTQAGSPVTVFSDPVTDGDTNFTASSDFGTSPGWHVTDSQDSTFGGPAWWYGNEATGTYQSPNPTDNCTDSSANSGTLTSPVITLPSNSQLSFDTLWQIESVNPSNFDLMQVQVIPVPNVLGLGDSVAAGYGLGLATGYPDNTSAYPNLLGQTLGVSSQDYAVAGACASSSESCGTAKPVDSQIGQVSNTFTPGVITVTVGANDINFSGCFAAIVKNSDLFLQSPSDPCNPTTLQTHLTALQQALTTDLQTLSGKYPTATILVMNYYNPLPQPPSSTGSPCVLDQVQTWLYEHSLGSSWTGIADEYVLDHSAFINEARYVQTQDYKDAQNIIGQLNGTIDTAAAGLATVIDTSDFTGHDMCAKTGQWIFAPNASFKLSFKGLTYHKALGGEVCPDPVGENPLVSKSLLGGTLKINVNLNCTPHPTPEGQAAIANDFYQQG
jgi:lysophospholipase L1-like esterase